MSWVLPVDNYQYQDYQQRVIRETENKHYIESPFKVVLNKKHQEISSQYDAMQETESQLTRPRQPRSYLYAEMTGKGQFLNMQA